jgi:cysteinyl-tRNA synthetase
VAGNEKIDAGNLAKLKKLYQDYVFDILGLKAESESVSQDHEVLGKILMRSLSMYTNMIMQQVCQLTYETLIKEI